jgi:hypothetical protein
MDLATVGKYMAGRAVSCQVFGGFRRTLAGLWPELWPGRQEAAAEGHGSHVEPAVGLLADERQFVHMDLASALKLRPALPGHATGGARLLLQVHLHNCQVRNVRPLLGGEQGAGGELVMQFTEAVRRPRDLDEHGWGGGQESFHVTQFHVERNHPAAHFFQEFDDGRFAPGQFARRKDGEMGRHVTSWRMELPAKLGDKLSYRTADVCHQCVAWTGHEFNREL